MMTGNDASGQLLNDIRDMIGDAVRAGMDDAHVASVLAFVVARSIVIEKDPRNGEAARDAVMVFLGRVIVALEKELEETIPQLRLHLATVRGSA